MVLVEEFGIPESANGSLREAPLSEEYLVNIERDPATGIATREAWSNKNKDGRFDRADGPAYIERDATTGTVTLEEWRKDGALHRVGGPAFIKRGAATGVVTYEQWRRDGQLHRTDGPALTLRDAATGAVTREELHKEGYPVPNGVLKLSLQQP